MLVTVLLMESFLFNLSFQQLKQQAYLQLLLKFHGVTFVTSKGNDNQNSVIWFTSFVRKTL